ncbi:MAG: protein kinase [Blastocatellia bacterium]
MDKHCILIADDDTMTLKILEKAFQSLDCKVITALNGQEALEKCSEIQPSLIISDWHMPILDGIDLFFHIKNSAALQHIPFIFLTTSDDEETKIALLETGVEDYWNKPFNAKEILIRTKKILSRLTLSQTGSQIINDLPQQAKGNVDTVTKAVLSPQDFLSSNFSDSLINYDEPNETYLHVSKTLNNRYKLLEPIGRGGMGIVYRTHDLQKNQEIALKLLRREYVSNSVEVRRFAREASTALRIKHPNVIETYEYGLIASGQAFITMEILAGHSLMNELRRNIIIPKNYALKIMKQACLGVLAAHKQDVIHRDLKPNNIFLVYSPENEPVVKVLDFGIAILQVKPDDNKSAPERLTDPNIIIGTPEYMSPEQINKRDIEKETDIYSLGIVFYEMLTGQVPFLGTDVEILIAHISKKPTPISQIILIEPEIASLIMSMLAKDPKNRPSLEIIVNTLDKHIK